MKELATHWRDFYRQEARIELQQAGTMLHTYADVWNESRETAYQDLNRRATVYLAKADALDELLRRYEKTQREEANP